MKYVTDLGLECEHEVDFNGPREPGDMDDVSIFKAACEWVRCKHCGCKGLCVDDTGNFWVDPDTSRLII